MKQRTQRLETSNGKGGKHTKFCTCGHLVMYHRANTGCIGVIEAENAEDHWTCGCMCRECIHTSEIQWKKLAKDVDIDLSSSSSS